MRGPLANNSPLEGFVRFKDRPEPTTKMWCRVYRNLNSAGYYSVLAAEGRLKGKVLGYAKCVWLSDVRFRIQQAGYRRVQKEQVRNVHGFAIGRFRGCFEELTFKPDDIVIRISYQPFKNPFFFDRTDPETAIHCVNEAWAIGPDLVVPRAREVATW